MKNLALFVVIMLFACCTAFAQEEKKDTVLVGIYITSIHDIDFKQKEFATTFWLWLKYKNPKLDFVNNLEVSNAKTVDKAFSTIDTTGDRIFLQMKLQCVLKDSWKISNFPFDEQKLRIFIENSQFDASSMVFLPDTLGEHYDKRYTLRGWNVDSCIITSGKKIYQTAFGNEAAVKQESEYSIFRVRLSITRDAAGLFWKMFLGMYLAFFISYICFYIHSDSMDSRFGLSVGSLFAVIGNKYIIDSSLPESSSFTLVDALHGITLFFILVVIAANAYSLRLIKQNKIQQGIRFDNATALIVLFSYLALNAWFIWEAIAGDL
ncbi:MAG TPA: hypothetical protein VK166_12955 [Chitinophagaceae bacterium]|nr:hypothetical protein [Chitinophagaceae bacterium]